MFIRENSEADPEPRVRTFASSHAAVGEGPIWLSDRSKLLWVDMAVGDINLTDFASGTTETFRPFGFVGAVVPRHSGGWIAGTIDGFTLLDDEGTITRTLNVLPPGLRMNDGKCDPMGRFWSGSTAEDFAPGCGAVHVLDADGRVTAVVEDVTLPNGLDWSPSGKTFYLADSVSRQLLAFDCDLGALAVTNRRVIHEFSESDGMPDGLCVDADGCIWVALWGGSAVVRLDDRGSLLGSIPIPARQPSSCAFGGPDLSTLFVTSAASGITQSAELSDGAVFAITGTGARGQPVNRCHAES